MKPYYDRAGITLYVGDCRDILPLLPAESVDLILTDPPYGIAFEVPKARRRCPSSIRGAGGSFGRDWGPITGDDVPFDPSHLLSFKRLILWGAHCYASRLPDSRGWLVWDKKRGGTVAADFRASACDLAWTNFLGYVRTYSHLWDGLRRDSEIGEHLHPTQKPVTLMSWCLSLVPDAQAILDPYCGTGPVLIAAKQLGRSCIGIEIEERYAEIAANRLSQEVLTFA